MIHSDNLLNFYNMKILIGKTVPVEKIFFSKKDLTQYLGVTERFVSDVINKDPNVRIYRLSKRNFLYSKDSIDRWVRNYKVR